VHVLQVGEEEEGGGGPGGPKWEKGRGARGYAANYVQPQSGWHTVAGG
jgi:hypothetical protein